MKIDILFPPPPLHNQKPLPCSDLTPARPNALAHLSLFAAEAESLIGTIHAAAPDGESPPFVATSRGFALHCFRKSAFASELAELLGRSKLSITAEDQVDAPHVMIIDVRKYWGVLGPIRGDIVLFADGKAAVVTQPLCSGCHHFEAVSLITDAEPQVKKNTHWASTVKWILRLIDEAPPPAPVPVPEPAAEPAATPAPAEESAPAPAGVEAAPSTEPETGRRGKRTGIR